MKRLLILTLALALLISLFGCASAMTTTQKGDYSPVATTTYKSGAKADESNGSGTQTAIRKIVKNASLSMETKDVPATYDELLAYAVARGGYEVNRNQRTVNDLITIEAQIKIKPDELDGFLDFAGTKATIVSSQTSTDDITEAYYDAQTRLKTMEKALETYYDFLGKAKSIEESLAVQNQINQMTQEIESLKGKIKLWDSLLAESTISLYIRQITDPVKTRKEINWSTLTFDDMGYLMQAGLTGLLNILANILQWTAIILVVSLPVWLPALIIILLVRKRRKKTKAQMAAALKEAEKSITPEAESEKENSAND